MSTEHSSQDTYGDLNPEWIASHASVSRFLIYVEGYEPNEKLDWQYKLRLIDHKYIDSEGYPIDAIMAGSSWEAAFARAGRAVTRALAVDKCIF